MASSGLTSERHAHFQLPTAARIAHILSFSGSYRESVGSRVQVVLETHKLKILPYQEQGNAMHVVRRGKYIIKVPLEWTSLFSHLPEGRRHLGNGSSCSVGSCGCAAKTRGEEETCSRRRRAVIIFIYAGRWCNRQFEFFFVWSRERCVSAEFILSFRYEPVHLKSKQIELWIKLNHLTNDTLEICSLLTGKIKDTLKEQS